MPHNEIETKVETQNNLAPHRPPLSLSSAALCAATIAYPISQYIAYFFVAIALLTGGIFLFVGDKRTISDYWCRLLFPMLPFLLTGIIFLTVGDIATTHLGLLLVIGSPLLSLAFSRTPYADRRNSILYSLFIASILTLWLGLRNSEWSNDSIWAMLDTLPAEILVLYLWLYFFGKHLYFSPRLFLLLCLRFSFSYFTALATIFFFTLLWLVMFVVIFYFGHTLLLLALFPFIFFPHLYRGIAYFRNIITRLSLWVIFTIAFLFGVSYVAHLIDDFYTPQYQPQRPYDLVTANGCPYTNDTTTKAYQQGYYHDLYVCREELENEWPRYSGTPLATEYAPGHTVYDALCRYLASDGHRRDSVGLSFLEPADVVAIERGATNSKLRNRGRLYWAIWRELENAERAKLDGNVASSPLLLAWRSVVQRDKSIESPIGIVESARRWGVLPIAFLAFSVVGSLLVIALKYKRRHAWHVLYLFLLASIVGHGVFTVYSLFFLLITVWWALRYKRHPELI